MSENAQEEIGTIMTEQQWKSFVESDALNFVIKYNLQSITLDDGAGKKGKIKQKSDGTYDADITIRNNL